MTNNALPALNSFCFGLLLRTRRQGKTLLLTSIASRQNCTCPISVIFGSKWRQNDFRFTAFLPPSARACQQCHRFRRVSKSKFGLNPGACASGNGAARTSF